MVQEDQAEEVVVAGRAGRGYKHYNCCLAEADSYL